MKRKKTSSKYQTDHYARKAKKENFPARSVYKLKEIQQKFKLIKKGDKVLDLGCAPGSWAKYAAELAGAEGRVIGIDLKKVSERFSANTRVIIGDVIELAQKDKENLAETIGTGYNVVLSDMAPATTGRKDVDAARSYYLCMAALTIAQETLKENGCFVCKIFQGEDFEEFKDAVCKTFDKHKIFKPQSCRKESKEIYIIGICKTQEEN
ncbi:MAG: RlmE family RNA methyltransferase [Desulfobacteraceae bacterium]|nr:RlmE family RNA methyltransferase [Desulfobacteraceae bacterium]MBC2753961.1 RlmE family RNA methyltransferase [Desulfobacteraceae bacterium]